MYGYAYTQWNFSFDVTPGATRSGISSKIWVPRQHHNLLKLLATPAGFEPATFSLEGCCSIP
jgi:hypothetical protein